MPLHRTGRLLFIHVPRTGGTSFKISYGMDSRPTNMQLLIGKVVKDGYAYLLDHMSADELLRFGFIDDATLQKCLVAMFVRHPLSRFISSWRRVCYMRPGVDWLPMSLRQFLDKAKQAVATGEFFVRVGPEYNFDEVVDTVHFRPQYTYLPYVTWVGRYERYSHDATRIAHLAALPIDQPLGNHNHADTYKHMNLEPAIRDEIMELYSEDCRVFGYSNDKNVAYSIPERPTRTVRSKFTDTPAPGVIKCQNQS